MRVEVSVMGTLSPDETVVLVAIVIAVAVGAVIAIRDWLANPFKYPYMVIEVDVSGRRTPDSKDVIDRVISKPRMWERIVEHERKVSAWKTRCAETIEASGRITERRKRQYAEVLDDEKGYRFVCRRMQTRYKQVNYKRSSYQVRVKEKELAADYEWLVRRHARLSEIGFEATLREYTMKDQRRLMTPALRRQIMERDNYTCQICGKRMRDGVGLQIDHIIPVAKGGRTVPSNLQVLCSKCNGSKGDSM